jgi:hypothetical protein
MKKGMTVSEAGRLGREKNTEAQQDAARANLKAANKARLKKKKARKARP